MKDTEIRFFEVSGEVCLEKEDVICYLQQFSDDIDDDYEPTDAEWEECAYDMFEKDTIMWSYSELKRGRRMSIRKSLY